MHASPPGVHGVHKRQITDQKHVEGTGNYRRKTYVYVCVLPGDKYDNCKGSKERRESNVQLSFNTAKIEQKRAIKGAKKISFDTTTLQQVPYNNLYKQI